MGVFGAISPADYNVYLAEQASVNKKAQVSRMPLHNQKTWTSFRGMPLRGQKHLDQLKGFPGLLAG